MIQANAEASTRNEPSNSLLHRYNQPNGFQGYAGRFNSAMLRKLQDSGQIASIEEDTIIRMADVQMAPLANWGLARISHHAKWQLNESFTYVDSAGEDVDVWILDTGVNEQLPDFEGRAHMATSFIPGEPANDTNGHGE
jgi:cerevisin